MNQPYREHFARFPDALKTEWRGGELDPEAIDHLLDGTDVVLSAETFYDRRVPEIARQRGVATVLQGNFEFLLERAEPTLPRPDLFLSPSTWRLQDWPEPTIHLPLPVDRDRLPFTLRTQAKVFLHVAGHRAMQDRAGTRIVLDAARKLPEESGARIVVRSQSAISAIAGRHKVEIHGGDLENYWELYEGADVLLAPRRYGGQSLVLNEGLSLGMPVLALDREPERTMLPPEMLIPARRAREVRTQGGLVGWYDTNGTQLAQRIAQLAARPDEVERLSLEADRIASALSWDALLPRYHEAFKTAIGMVGARL